MITLSGFILLLTALYSSIRLFFFSRQCKSIYYLCLAISATSLAVGVTMAELEPYLPYIDSNLIMDWSRTISVSFVMSGLALFLWMSKPVFARFPVLFCSIPLLLIAVFPFTNDSTVVKEVVLAMFQGGAIAIAVLLYTLKSFNNTNSFYVIGGLFILLIAFILFWLPANYITIPIWAVKLTIASAIFIIVSGLAKLVEDERVDTPAAEYKTSSN